MSDMCEHPFCSRSISKKCSNHCQLDLCEEHLTEHQNLFLVQYEKSFHNLKKFFQELINSVEEAKKTIDINYQKNLSLINNISSNEIEQKSSLILSTQNLIKKKLQLLNDVKNDQALLYQYDIEQIKLYRTIIGNYQSTEMETVPSTSSTASSSSLSNSNSNSNFTPESDNDEDDDDENDTNYYHKSDPNSKRKDIMNYYGPCPLTRLGIYGLHQKHNLVLCPLENSNKSDHHLMTHFYNYHHIKWLLAYKLTGAIIDKSNPLTTTIFQSNIDIIDKRFYVRYCPLKEMNLSNCRKKFFKDSLEQHLINVHHLSFETRKKIVQTIETNGRLTALDLDRNEFLV